MGLTLRLERAGRVLAGAATAHSAAGMKSLARDLQGGFSSPDLREPFGKKPKQALLAHLTAILFAGGFSQREIGVLLNDGVGGAGFERIDRVKKRLRTQRR
jgi:hypothetical protein